MVPSSSFPCEDASPLLPPRLPLSDDDEEEDDEEEDEEEEEDAATDPLTAGIGMVPFWFCGVLVVAFVVVVVVLSFSSVAAASV